MANLNQNLKNIIEEAGQLAKEINENAQNSVEVEDNNTLLKPNQLETVKEAVKSIKNGNRFNGIIYAKNNKNGTHTCTAYIGSDRFRFVIDSSIVDEAKSEIENLLSITKLNKSYKNEVYVSTHHRNECLLNGFYLDPSECE